MCGRFSLTASNEGLVNYFGLSRGLALEPRYNIAPTQPVAAVRVEEGERRVERLRALLQPAAPGVLEMYPVSTYVNKAGNEGGRCVEPAASGN